MIGNSTNKTPLTITVNEGDKVYIYEAASQSLPRAINAFGTSQIQLELGTTATPYEEYKGCQTITATPSGTEIDSMCPNMTFIADTDITVDYFSSFGMAEKELAMWNAFTNFGKRENYTYAWGYNDYSGHAIPLGMCKPKISMAQMFYNYQGVELPRGIDCSDFDISTTTQSYHCYNTFAYAYNLIRIYDIGIPAVKFYNATYRSCSNLESIEIIRVNESSVFDNNCFNGCSKLTHCIFSGVIASDINLQWSKNLDAESLMSLVDCLMFMEDVYDGDGELVEQKAYTKTITLSPESWAILDSIPHPNGEGNTKYTYKDHVGAQQWLAA